jgi:hypothetical protein
MKIGDDSDHDDDNDADMSNNGCAVLPAAARLMTPHTLAIYLCFTVHVVSTDDLLALRLLTLLRCLIFGGGHAPAVTDGHMWQLLAALPLLQTICCGFVLRRGAYGMLQAIGRGVLAAAAPRAVGRA